MANSKSSKPPTSNTKPTTEQLPTEQDTLTTSMPSTPPAKPKEQGALTQQIGNDQEDIFSPLRESMLCTSNIMTTQMEGAGVQPGNWGRRGMGGRKREGRRGMGDRRRESRRAMGDRRRESRRGM